MSVNGWHFLELVLQTVQVIGLAVIAAWVRTGVLQRQPLVPPEQPAPDPASPSPTQDVHSETP